jgi:DNA-binding LacI/PurR family transcriptional regulator
MIAHIRDEVRERVLSGSWKPGMLLPSRRAIAAEFNVNPITVQRALMPLLEDNLLVSDGRGTFVSGTVHTAGKGAPGQPADGEAASDAAPLLMQNTLVFVSVVPPGNYSDRHATGWMHVLDQGVIATVRRSGLHLMTLNPTQVQPEEWDYIRRNRPLGVIVEEFGPQSAILEPLTAYRNAGIPVTGFGDIPQGLRCDAVVSDHREGAYRLTKWLLERGCRRILQPLPRSFALSWPSERRRGYEQALREAGIEECPVVHMPDLDEVGAADDRFEAAVRLYAGYIAPYVLADRPIDAIMAPSDGEVPVIASACRILRKTPNEDIAIVGYDNYWAEAETTSKDATAPLATVDKDNFRIGEELVRLTIARSQGDLAEEPVREMIAPRLVILNGEAGPAKPGA